MHNNVKRLNFVKNKVKEILDKKQLKTNPQIIAVTKTFPLSQITPLLEMGHIHFGENKVQEAEAKWLQLRNEYKNLQLHMLGKLQTNKAKKLDLFANASKLNLNISRQYLDFLTLKSGDKNIALQFCEIFSLISF